MRFMARVCSSCTAAFSRCFLREAAAHKTNNATNPQKKQCPINPPQYTLRCPLQQQGGDSLRCKHAATFKECFAPTRARKGGYLEEKSPIHRTSLRNGRCLRYPRVVRMSRLF